MNKHKNNLEGRLDNFILNNYILCGHQAYLYPISPEELVIAQSLITKYNINGWNMEIKIIDNYHYIKIS